MIRSRFHLFVITGTIERNATGSKYSMRCYHFLRPSRQLLCPHQETETQQLRLLSTPPTKEQKSIRLSKRMGELDMFSRREADRLIMDGRVFVDGKLVEVGHKVPQDLQADQIVVQDKIDLSGSSTPHTSIRKDQNFLKTNSIHNTNQISAVVLNKPKGYVSGQAEHGHPPAIRLLTSRNRVWGDNDLGQENRAHEFQELSNDARNRRHFYDWKGFAPAGRLDLDSTGLLVFTKTGVLAKKIIGSNTAIEKEYIADLEPAINPTKRELSLNPNFVLPSFSSEEQRFNLSPILEGGGLLLGDDRPLKACSEAEWLVEGKKLRIVLVEGRKHHIRRMCRELLGLHVVGLHRVRIGPIVLPSDDSNDRQSNINGSMLPEGCWRPLWESEIEYFIEN